MDDTKSCLATDCSEDGDRFVATNLFAAVTSVVISKFTQNSLFVANIFICFSIVDIHLNFTYVFRNQYISVHHAFHNTGVKGKIHILADEN